MKGLDGGFIAGCWKNISLDIQSDAIEEHGFEGMLHGHRIFNHMLHWSNLTIEK